MTPPTSSKDSGRRAKAPDPIDQEVGTRVRGLRLGKRLARARLAEEVAATDERLRKGEAGSPGALGPRELYFLGRALGVRIDDLFPALPGNPGARDPLDTPEGRALYAWFSGIGNRETRSHLAALAKTLAEAYPAECARKKA